MLPEIGTRDRENLEQEALQIGLQALHEHDGRITDALYAVYMHFRQRFIEERGLMDRAPGGDTWTETLTDARHLEHYVSQIWATQIVYANVLRKAS